MLERLEAEYQFPDERPVTTIPTPDQTNVPLTTRAIEVNVVTTDRPNADHVRIKLTIQTYGGSKKSERREVVIETRT